MTEDLTVSAAIERYVDTVRLARSENTARTYTNALRFFTQVLDVRNISPRETKISEISEEALIWTISALNVYAPTTERLYLAALTGFYEFLAAERLAEINLPRLRLLIRQRARRPGQRLPQFPREDIEKLLESVESYAQFSSVDEKEHLRALRERAFMVALADTGLRVHEVCQDRKSVV